MDSLGNDTLIGPTGNSYSDMRVDWTSQSFSKFEIINLILYAVFDTTAICVLIAFVIHMILMMRYPEYKMYEGDKEYIRICDFVGSGKCLFLFNAV